MEIMPAVPQFCAQLIKNMDIWDTNSDNLAKFLSNPRGDNNALLLKILACRIWQTHCLLHIKEQVPKVNPGIELQSEWQDWNMK